tara:strand:+ start:2722 stop:3006 length:285 start_codon:yes stop_codon:yes gene_type:complete
MKNLLKTNTLLFTLILIFASCEGDTMQSDAKKLCDIQTKLMPLGSEFGSGAINAEEFKEKSQKFTEEIKNIESKYSGSKLIELTKLYAACMPQL